MNNAAEPKERTKRSVKNLIYGVAGQLVTVLFSMAVRKAVVACLGIEYAGLNGLFNEVIAIMALSELGIGSAITYAMYKPLAENDTHKLAALMNLFSHTYRIIFFVITGVGLALTPFIHLLVKEVDFPLSYIRLVFLLFVAKTAVSYLFSYKSALVTADQRMFAVSIINTVVGVLSSCASLLLIVFTGSFVAYLVSQIVFVAAQNIAVSVYADRRYPFLKEKAVLEPDEKKSIFKNIRNIFVGKVSGKITNSTDNILISLLVGTVEVGFYSNYAMIISAVSGVVLNLQSSLSAGVGNMLAVDEPDKCSEVLKRLSFMSCFTGCVGGACMYALLTPFVSLWLGAEYAISSAVVFFLSLNFFYSTARLPLWVFMQNSGLFDRDRNISIIGSSVNLVVSLAAGWKFGMLGIFIGTTCTHVIQIVLKSLLLYKKRFRLPPARYLLLWLVWSALAVGLQLLCGFVCSYITLSNEFISFVLRLLCTLALSGGLLCALFCRTSDFKYFLWLLKKTLVRAK